MRHLTITILMLAFGHFLSAQEFDPWISKKTVSSIKADVEKEIPTLKKQLVADGLNEMEVEFAIDTFRVERLVDLLREENEQFEAINLINTHKGVLYDQLLNKYYKKLFGRLEPEDRETLKKTQRAWLAYRDAEEPLIHRFASYDYTAGLRLYGLYANMRLSEMIKARTVMLFNYYQRIDTERY